MPVIQVILFSMNIYIHTLLNPALSASITDSFGQHHRITFRTEQAVPQSPPENFLDADAILGNPPLVWFENAQARNLKFWQLDSAGFDQYRQADTNAKVANMGDWFARPCAETIVGGILALYRGLNKLAVLQKEKKWVGTPIRGELGLLYRKNVAVLGSGTIGLAVRSILSGFGTNTKLVARSSAEADIHSREALFEILPFTDIVINTLPGAAGKYVDDDFLQAMKKGSVYANVGRGSTTDEQALIRLLKNGDLAGAVLDVTEKEPIPSENPLWEMDNVILTQHSGGGQANEDSGKAANFIENFSRFLKGEKILFEVSLSRGY